MAMRTGYAVRPGGNETVSPSLHRTALIARGEQARFRLPTPISSASDSSETDGFETGLGRAQCETVGVVVIELIDGDGSVVRRLPDPSGGTFDAAGDFQRFIDETGLLDAEGLPRFRTIEPYETHDLRSAEMPSLIADVETCLAVAKPGSEMRGLMRLRVLADLCAADSSLRLRSHGD